MVLVLVKGYMMTSVSAQNARKKELTKNTRLVKRAQFTSSLGNVSSIDHVFSHDLATASVPRPVRIGPGGLDEKRVHLAIGT